MQVEQSYQRYLDKVEKNGLNDNSSTDRGRFVRLRNEQATTFLQFILNRKGDDTYRYAQKLLVPSLEITSSAKTEVSYNFKLPENYFEIANVSAKASRGNCKKEQIRLTPQKEENLEELLQDEFQNPSFLYRETFYTLNSDNVNVFYTDFTIDSINLSYYKYPTQITLINPLDSESKFDENFQTDFDDKIEDIIISLCAGQFSLNNSDQIFQAIQQNAITKI